MGAPPLPYLFQPRARGRTYTYYRRNGQRIKLPAPGSPGFLEAYQRAHQHAETKKQIEVPERNPDPEGSLAALINAYRRSEEWRALAPNTKRDYDKALEPLRLNVGKLQVVVIERRFVLGLRDKFARKKIETVNEQGQTVTVEVATPRRANRMVNVFRLLMTWAVDRGWRKDNPALRTGQLATGPGYTRWSDEAFTAFMEHPKVDETLKRAAALGFYTGQRKGDCLTLKHGARKQEVIDGAPVRWIELTPSKTKNSTGVSLIIPEHPKLTKILDAEPGVKGSTLLTRKDGQPWKEDHFNHAFASAAKVAGLEGLTFHGLRKAASSKLVEAGCTDAEAESILGHADSKMTRLYRSQADQRALAQTAIRKLMQHDQVCNKQVGSS